MTSTATSVSTETAPSLVNPYWEEVQTFPQDKLLTYVTYERRNVFTPDSYPRVTALLKKKTRDIAATMDAAPSRHSLVGKYAWAIPSDDAIRWLATEMDGRSIVEIGAGSGYWAWLLGQLGVDVVAYDISLVNLGEDNVYFKHADSQVWHPIHRGGPEMAALHADRVLMLCWPPYDDPMASEALTAYQGDTLVFIGEGHGGCTGDDAFHELLDAAWEEVASYDDMIQWSGIHDYMTIYRRQGSYRIQEAP